jgi:hypothetical protein
MKTIILEGTSFEFANLFMDHGIDIKEILEDFKRLKRVCRILNKGFTSILIETIFKYENKGFLEKELFFECLNNKKIEMAKVVLFKELVK